MALIWPYKDCTLQGGLEKEKGKEKRNEIFYNELLGKNAIDRLLDTKTLSHFKRIDKEGEKNVEDAQDLNNSDNLLIEGNNLLALHSLEKKFYNKIKLIYIDPPYNTGGDANIFTYNNDFNHSSWLTFMKNRLEIAKKLLRNDGFIAIAIDHCELLYLGVLADEIFGRDNRLGIVTVVTKPEGRSQKKFFGDSNEFMLVYAKDKDKANFNKVVINEKVLKYFNLEDEKGKYKIRSFIRGEGNRKDKPNLFYPIYIKEDMSNISLNYIEGYQKIFPTVNQIERTWFLVKDSFLTKWQKNEIVLKKDIIGKIKIYYKVRETEVFTTHWDDKKYNATAHGTNLLKKLLGRNVFSYPKSLYLIQDVIKIMTDKNDIILDFFAGSGTTAHATIAQNQEDGGNRKFILIEQLTDHIAICKERLQKVLNQTQSTHSFLFAELHKLNQKFLDNILKADSKPALVTIFQEILAKAVLDPSIIEQEIPKTLNENKTFQQLSLAQQKQILLQVLDKNMLFLPLTEIEDQKYAIPKHEIELNKEFYDLS